jgi:uncharacterized protein (TIGR02147 family)
MRRGPKLDVFRYLSFRVFLADWFAAQKEADSRFSHRLFARRAQVQSPSLFNEIVAGKRNLTATNRDGFIRALQLGREEGVFFADLVALDQARTEDDKNAAWERVAASRRFRSARPIEGGMFAYLSNWYYPATRELALRADFIADPDWVCVRLQPQITKAQARDALKTLFALGMLEEVKGQVRPTDVSLATANEVAGLALHNYHRQMLQRAADSIVDTLAPERHLLGVTVAIPTRLVGRLKAELDGFQARLLHLCDEHSSQAERVYQIHLCLFPLSSDPAVES